MSAIAVFLRSEDNRASVPNTGENACDWFKRGNKPFKETQKRKNNNALYEKCIIDVSYIPSICKHFPWPSEEVIQIYVTFLLFCPAENKNSCHILVFFCPAQNQNSCHIFVILSSSDIRCLVSIITNVLSIIFICAFNRFLKAFPTLGFWIYVSTLGLHFRQ